MNSAPFSCYTANSFWMKMNFGKRRNDMFKIGNHLSSSKGYEAMGKMAVKLGANTFAFFTRNPRG